MDPVRAIADAVLYEGYVLWPYRRSALKNQRRWTFGGVYPEAHTPGRDDDPCTMRTDCLLEAGDDADVDVRVRFLHVVRRRVAAGAGRAGGARRRADRGRRAPPGLGGGGRARGRVPGWACRAAAGRRTAIDVPAGADEEELREADGGVAGALVRSWEPLTGSVDGRRASASRRGLLRVTVTIANTTPWDGGDARGGAARARSARRTPCCARAAARSSR